MEHYLTLADNDRDEAVKTSSGFMDPDEINDLDSAFGRILRGVAGAAGGAVAQFVPGKAGEAIGKVLTGYSATPEFKKPSGGDSYSPPQGNFPMVIPTPQAGPFTQKNLLIGAGVLVGIVVLFKVLHK